MIFPRFVGVSPSLAVRGETVGVVLPTVSVVIATNRRDSMLRWTLASLAAVEGVDLEVLVFDDTPLQDLSIEGDLVPRVRVVRRREDASRGLGFARSRLLSQVDGDVIVVMDDDFIVDGQVLKDLAEVHNLVDFPVIASAPLYMVREEFARDVTPQLLFDLVRCGELARLASAYLLDSHYTVKEYGMALNSSEPQSQTLLAGHNSFASFRADMPKLLGIDYLPIRRAEDSAFGDAAFTRGADLVWCQAGYALHLGTTEMDRLRANDEEFQQYETWRRAASFGWLPTSGRPNILPARGLDRTWARPTIAICMFLKGQGRTAIAELISELSRWDIRDWVVTVADDAELDPDSYSVLEQALLDDQRFLTPGAFMDARWDATWQVFIKPQNLENVRGLLRPLAEWPLHRLHASSGWAEACGYIVRSHLLARKHLGEKLGWTQGKDGTEGHMWDEESVSIPTSADLKGLQSEEEKVFHLVLSPEFMLMSDDTVAPAIDLATGGSRVAGLSKEPSRVTIVAHRDELNQALGTHRRDLIALAHQGVLFDTGTPWSPTKGDLEWAGLPLRHQDYLSWRINQKRQFLDLTASPEVDKVSFGIVTTTKRPEMWSNLVANLARQIHQPNGLLVVCHGWTPNETQLEAIHELHIPHTTITTADRIHPHSKVVAQAVCVFGHGEWFVKMDDDDLYGAHFLRELATHITLNPSYKFFGMYAEFVETIQPHKRRLDQHEIGWQESPGLYQPGCPAGGTMCVHQSVLQPIGDELRGVIVGVDARWGQALSEGRTSLHVVDGLNYVLRRFSDPMHAHTWNIGGDVAKRSWVSSEYRSFLTFLYGSVGPHVSGETDLSKVLKSGWRREEIQETIRKGWNA